jgi:hypothetical protein
MKKNTVRYFYSNPEEHFIYCHGLPFNRFLDCYKDQINGLLLIEHEYGRAAFHRQSRFYYVTQAALPRLSDDNIHDYGNFSWVDFQSKEALDALSSQDIAELLYFGHMGEPLASPFLNSLDNRFAYWGHDDGWYCKVCFRDMNDAVPLLSSAIEELFGYPKKGERLNALTLGEYMLSISEQGILMDSGRMRKSPGQITLPICIAGKTPDIDGILNGPRQRLHETGHIYDINYDTKLNILKLESAISA